MSTTQIKDGFYKIELNKTIWEVPQRYQLLSPVGAGAYGQVCSALDTQTNIKVAVKKLARPFQSAIHAKRTYREIRMLRHMHHENVIGLLDIFTPTLTLEDFNDVYLVTPLMGADLNNIIKTQRLSDDHVQFLVYQILRGMKYIHSAGIIHRDLKPSNVACTPDNWLKDLKPSNIAVNEDCELKILDFGLARHTEDQMTGYVATRWYRAPEIVLNWMHYGQTVDIWSVGCIMAEMLTGKALFPGNDHIHQLRLVLTLTGTPPQHLLDKITDEDAYSWLFQQLMYGGVGRHFIYFLTGGRVQNIDQLTRVLSLVGTPNQKLLDKISSPEARNYVASMPKWPKKDFREVFIGANPLAIDLMEKMLDLDSETRITAEQALAHPYLAQYADPSDEPTAQPFDQSFENMELSIPEWRRLCYEEAEGRGSQTQLASA